MSVCTLVGTAKGAFLLRSENRVDWSVEGPLFKGWKVTAATRDADGRIYVATASDVYGPAIHASEDLASWRQLEAVPAWPEASERKLNQIWTLVAGRNRLLAGVDVAGLFESHDRGESWQPVEGLNEHATRDNWYPGAGGLCAHSVLLDPRSPERMWVGISAVGVFRSDDAGLSWTPKNRGVPVIIEDKRHKDIGYCVHALAQHPDDAATIFRQDHRGMFVTRDGGDSWQAIQNGLPSTFGFPLGLDPNTGALFSVPLESDEYRMPRGGELAVYRSRDEGASWQPLRAGLPDDHYSGVLRGALAVDGLDPCGVTFGTSAGTVHTSANCGDTWNTVPCSLPRVLSVRTFLEG
jgi:hypothetical protein